MTVIHHGILPLFCSVLSMLDNQSTHHNCNQKQTLIQILSQILHFDELTVQVNYMAKWLCDDLTLCDELAGYKLDLRLINQQIM